jgi:hypothetical protein
MGGNLTINFVARIRRTYLFSSLNLNFTQGREALSLSTQEGFLKK